MSKRERKGMDSVDRSKRKRNTIDPTEIDDTGKMKIEEYQGKYI
jgi:hypothetical protein